MVAVQEVDAEVDTEDVSGHFIRPQEQLFVLSQVYNLRMSCVRITAD